MADMMNPPVLHREEDKIIEIYNEISNIRQLINTGVSALLKGKVETPSTNNSPNMLGDNLKKLNESIKESTQEQTAISKEHIEKQNGFFKNLTDSFLEKSQELVSGVKNVGKNLGESAFNMMLGSFQLITKPLEELGNFKLFDVITGFFKRKKVSGKPTRAQILKIDPGAVYIADALAPPDKKEGFFSGLLSKIFGKEGIFSKFNPLTLLLKILKMTGLFGIFAGLTLTDILGKGGALEFFKKGDIGKGIMTALFGKDLSQKGALGKILGIGKQALKWGALGALIGSIIPGLGTVVGGIIGIGFGLLGGAIKLGIDTGFFKNIWKQINTKGTVLNKVAKILTKGAMFGAIGALIGSLIPGLGTLIGAGLGFGLGLVAGGIQLGIDTGFFKKIWMGIKKATKSLGNWFMKSIFNPIKDLFNKVIDFIYNDIIKPMIQGFSNVFSGIRNFVSNNIIQPLKDFWNWLGGVIKTGWEQSKQFVSNVFTWVDDNIIKPLSNFFTDLFNTISSGLTKGWNSTVKFITNIVSFIDDNIIKPIKNIFVTVKNKITSFVKNKFNFIEDLFTHVKDAIFGLIGKIINFFKFIGKEGILGSGKLLVTGKFGSELEKFNEAEEYKRKALSGTDNEINRHLLELAKQSIKANPSLTLSQAFAIELNKALKKISDVAKPVSNTVIESSDFFHVKNIDKVLR